MHIAVFLTADFDVHFCVARQPQRIWNVLKTHFAEGHIGSQLIEPNLTVGRKQIAAHAEDLEVAFVHLQDSLRQHIRFFPAGSRHNGCEANLARALRKCQYIRLA
jgi:hypothetical protein